ncbi:unnamed protein product [Protopolystoma xenopodis]|uniref:Uncharacterized protein n=1 Tax=Protopolystoma xenopodis TaxID=117903 RepID=A0A448WIR2_9PLAT|nr:unnamed protein product [Protopolystoma xenopodis]
MSLPGRGSLSTGSKMSRSTYSIPVDPDALKASQSACQLLLLLWRFTELQPQYKKSASSVSAAILQVKSIPRPTFCQNGCATTPLSVLAHLSTPYPLNPLRPYHKFSLVHIQLVYSLRPRLFRSDHPTQVLNSDLLHGPVDPLLRFMKLYLHTQNKAMLPEQTVDAYRWSHAASQVDLWYILAITPNFCDSLLAYPSVQLSHRQTRKFIQNGHHSLTTSSLNCRKPLPLVIPFPPDVNGLHNLQLSYVITVWGPPFFCLPIDLVSSLCDVFR